MSVLSRLIPPPSYLTMPCVGVDISDTSLKYVSFHSNAWSKADRQIKDWGDIPVPNGVLDRGQVVDPQQLTAVLKEFKTATKGEFVRVSLPEERAYLFETEIRRSTPAKEVRGLLEFRLEENVPIPSKDVLFDYVILPSDSDSRVAQVVVAAYARETIMQYYEACVAAGLRPVSFEVEAQAMARAVVPKDVTGAVMLVDFGKTRTGIGIAYKGVLLYTSTIDVGGDVLSQALRRVLGAEIAESELTKIKNTRGLIRGVDSGEAADALLNAVSIIKDEIATRMQYWHLRNGNSDMRRIGSIVLCGGSANLKGLPAYFSETLGVPTVRANVWENTFSLDHIVPPIDRNHSFGYATAIGLALKDSA
ncbi:pilus assembly protein PilM [Candidatus Kaiserbacteria bacterium]|nr:pilus assembly protein PilM [Candidatus Kaiserbacteria bacterium]USN89096.1 MAG: pilus assembly protein PilM [Candidatus Nomurabacteria bacterium]